MHSNFGPSEVEAFESYVKDYQRPICEFRSQHWLLCILCGSWISIIILCGVCYSSECLCVISAHHLPQDSCPLSLNPVFLETNILCCCTILHMYTKTLQKTHTNTRSVSVTLKENGPVCLSCNRGSFSPGNRFIGLVQPFVCNPQHT